MIAEFSGACSWLFYGDPDRPGDSLKNDDSSVSALPELLEQGWEPVREIPIQAPPTLFRAGRAYCLILLQR